MARIPYVERESASPEVQEVFRKLEKNGARVLNIYRMAGHSRAALLPMIKLGNSLMTRAELDGKLRELVILRMATLGGSRYEWEQHAAIARDIGVTEEQIAGVPAWEKSDAFDDREKAVLTFADELAKNGDVSDETFALAGSFLKPAEIVELTLSTVFWKTMAHFLVTLRIDVEEGGGVFGRKR